MKFYEFAVPLAVAAFYLDILKRIHVYMFSTTLKKNIKKIDRQASRNMRTVLFLILKKVIYIMK